LYTVSVCTLQRTNIYGVYGSRSKVPERHKAKLLLHVAGQRAARHRHGRDRQRSAYPRAPVVPRQSEPYPYAIVFLHNLPPPMSEEVGCAVYCRLGAALMLCSQCAYYLPHERCKRMCCLHALTWCSPHAHSAFHCLEGVAFFRQYQRLNQASRCSH
jgi:hypothetical protein